MSRTLLVPLPVLLLACAPKPIDQADADAIAADLVPDLVVADAPWQLVRAGTVTADVPIVEGDPLATEADPPVETTPTRPGFLFLLDRAPHTFFEHDVAWILVDDAGDTTTTPARWWPEIDGAIPPGLRAALDGDADDDIVDANDLLQRPTGNLPVFDIPRFDYLEGNAYIVVQGLLPGEVLHGDATLTGESGRDFFLAYEDGASETVYLAEGDADTVLDAVDAGAAEHAVVTVAIIAHGSVDGVSLGGVGFTAAQFRAAFAAHPNTTFNFLLGSCHGGSFVDDLSSLSNVGAVLTAVAADQGAEPDWDVYTGGPAVTDVNAADVGSEWFSSVYAAAATLTASSIAYADVASAADSAGVPLSTALLCLAADGATGDRPDLGLTDDLDFSHFLGGHTPQRHCAVP